MSSNLNLCQFIGNVCQDPEMRFTPSGAPTTSFSVAVNRTYKTNDGESKSEATFINVVSWNKTAEICNQFLNKGSLVYIQGRLKLMNCEFKILYFNDEHYMEFLKENGLPVCLKSEI